ncbi:MAG: alpha/beta fold hydrolase, partial [Planctomycetota bacterium]|nr:alpha/beta fold hydrolase [Planctomycetota bacterium]
MSPRNPRRPRNLTFAVLLAILCAPIAWIGRADEETPAALYLELTLDGGKVDVRAMLRGAYAALQLEPPEELDDLDWRIDADSALGKARLESIRRRTDGLISATVEDDALKVRLQYAGHDETTDESRAAIESRLDRLVRALVLQRQPAYGVFFPRPHDVPLRPARYAEERETVPRRIVLLVHGLDDPGWLWDDVIEALRKEGHVVARLEYPNDGPIVDAADLLMQSLLELHALGVRRVDVVAHSMGGLVTRDVLTRPAYYGGDGEGDDAGPAIDRLIMCGTPNQGSSIARLRAVAGIGEQLSRLFSDRRRTMDLTGLADGAGEAAIDLSPGSAFLTQL